MFTKNFAVRLKKVRIDKGCSQKKISEICSVGQGFFSEVEQGHSLPSSSFILSIYKQLAVNINWLLTGEGEVYVNNDSKVRKDELSLGVRLKKCRKSLNLTQDEFGKKLSVTHGFISRIEKNNSAMGAEFLYKLNLQFNVNINWLLAGDGPMFLNAERPVTAATPQSNPDGADKPDSAQTDESPQLTPEEVQALRAILKNPRLKSIISKIDDNPDISPEEILMLEAIRTKSYIKSIVIMADNMSDTERNNLFAYIAEKMRISDLKHGTVPDDEDIQNKKRA